MSKSFAVLALAFCALVSGCSTPQPVVATSNDAVDSLLSKSAISITEALRDLSEASGASRVVQAAPAAQPAASAQVAQDSRNRPAEPARVSIAAKRAIIAVEEITPQADVSVTPAVISTGVVASGGLLSSPPPGLERLITVRWTGELEQLLARIATETGWTLAQSKGFRVTPVIISVNAESRSAFDLLRDVGAIAGSAAEIQVSAARRTITVQYPQR